MRYYDVYIRRFGDEFKASYIPRFVRDDGEPFIPKKHENAVVGDKFLNNIIRAKNTVLEYALCNDFTHFITCTIDSSKYARDDLQTFYSDFSRFIRNIRVYYNCDIKYIFIPELHSDKKNWHLHGLISGIPDNQLFDFSPDLHPLRLCNKGYKYWGKYEKKFGFCSLGLIKSTSAVSRYIIKYITKDLGLNIPKGSHLYYCSNGLKKSTLVFQGSCVSVPDDAFESEFCFTRWSNNLDDYVDLF